MHWYQRLFLLVFFIPTPLLAFNFDQLSQQQYEQMKGFVEQFHSAVDTHLPREKVNDFVLGAFSQVKSLIAEDILSAAKRQQVQKFSQQQVDVFIQQLPSQIRAQIFSTERSQMQNLVSKEGESLLLKYQEILIKDINDAMPKCKSAIQLDLVALLFNNDSKDAKGLLEFQFTKECVLKASNINESVNALLVGDTENINNLLQQYVAQRFPSG